MTQATRKRRINLGEWEFSNDEILSVKEAALFADLFDDIGEFHNANLMDEYIRKMGEAQDDLIKQAGLFRNLLRKLVGFGKRIFFKVYRELYAKAKEAQQRLDDRVSEINKAYDNIKKDLRYHDIEGWRGGIYSLGLEDSKEIVGDFDVAYGKLIQYLGLTGESGKGKPPEGDLSQIEKLPDVEKPEVVPGAEVGKWERETSGAKEGWNEIARNIAFNPSQGALRFDRKYFDYLLGKHISTDGAGNVRYWSSYKEDKQPLQGKLKEMMGDSVWNLKEDENFAYLYPTERGTETGAPPVETPETDVESEFEEPELPKDEKVYPLTKKKEKPAEVSQEELEEGLEEVSEEPEIPETTEEETPEEPETTEEEAPEEPKTTEELEKPEEGPTAELVQRQSPRQTVWIEKARAQRKKDGELWTRFTKVYPGTAQRYQKEGRGRAVQDPDLISFLDKAVPQKFPGHSANVSKIWLPADLEKREKYIEMAEQNWAKKKTTSRLETLNKLYKTAVREKWLK
jgi:hypothetical protein